MVTDLSRNVGRVRERLRQLVAEGRVSSQAEAARLLGVSRERVRQLVASEGLGLRRRPALPVLCPRCGKDVTRRYRGGEGLCYACGHGARPVACPRCGRERLLTPARVRRRVTAYCRECWRAEAALLARRPRKESAGREAGADLPRCRQCGRERSAAAAARGKSGLCRSCSGRENIRLAHAAAAARKGTVRLRCPGCGRERELAPSRARQRASGLCSDCWRRSTPRQRREHALLPGRKP